MSEGLAIDARDVVKRFGDGPAVLDGVDLQVSRAEIVAIVGPSGGGKSTLLHLLAALDRPASGSIHVDGIDVAVRHRHAVLRRRHVGIVFQLHNLLPRLTARENVEVAMLGTHRSSRQRRERAELILRGLGLGSMLARSPSELSGGERQRVAIARALANDPAVLLADEPTGSLDAATTANVIATFERIRADRHATVVIVTHDEAVVRAADRVLELDGGRLRPLP